MTPAIRVRTLNELEETLRSRRQEIVERLRQADLHNAVNLRSTLRSVMEFVPGGFAHASAVASAAMAIGKAMGLTKVALADIEFGALFHDIGKAALPRSIFANPGALDDAERWLIQRHSDLGFEVAAEVAALGHAAPLIHASHEWFDGRGYPRGLAGEDIAIGSRIVSVADAFDVMTQRGTYSARMTPTAAIAELRREAGTQFDPRVVEFAVPVLLCGPDQAAG